MANDLWGDEPPEEFRDIPDETKLDGNGQPMQSAPIQVPIVNRPAPPTNQSYRPSNIPAEPAPQPQKSRFDVEVNMHGLLDIGTEEDDFTEVLNDANLRIEQGRLYQMIMNHDLFQGMDADPKAIQNVEKEIRKFARERMEIMLGMRQEQLMKDYIAYDAQLANPFNELQIEVLKMVASKASNGATDSPEANEIASTFREPSRRQTLNPIGGSTALRRPQPPKPAAPQAKLQNRPTAPIVRKKNDVTVEQILAEEGVPRELVEEEYVGIGKPLHQLTPEELAKRQKETALRLAKRTTVKSASALPMASPEQQEMLALQRASQIGQAPGMQALLDKVKSMPIKNP